MESWDLMEIDPGIHMTKCCGIINAFRKRMSVCRMSELQKKRRKILTHSKKKTQDKDIEKEGLSYEAGGFSMCYID